MAMTDMNDSTDKIQSLLTEELKSFLGHLTMNGMSQNTVRAYRADLKGLTQNITTPMISVDRATIEQIAAEHLTAIRETYSPNTVNRKLACFRRFGKYMGWQDFLANYKPPKPAKGYAHPIPEGIAGILAMADVARKPEHKALVALCGMLGLRISEARRVRPSHFNHRTNELRVFGKGDKQRDVPVSETVWQHIMPALIKNRDADTVLIPLHDRSARRAWTRLAEKAGLSHSSSHDGRMTVGTEMYYKSGGDIRAVQEYLGHASSVTTETYTKVNSDRMRAAADIFGGD